MYGTRRRETATRTSFPAAYHLADVHASGPDTVTDPPPTRPVRLATVSSPHVAHLLAARLAAEGISCRLTGGVDSPYRLTVGPMARVDLWVLPDDLDDARTVMVAAEVDDTLGGRLSDERRVSTVRPGVWLAAAFLLVVLAIALVSRTL